MVIVRLESLDRDIPKGNEYMSKLVAAIVVTYNRKELLRENIESLLAQTCRDILSIIVVDNASTDGTKEYIAQYIDRGDVIYLNTGANVGGAGGFNFGMRYAAEHDYAFMWLMDDDCVPMPDALEVFVKWHNKLKGRYGFLSGKAIWTDGNICKMNSHGIDLVKRVEDYSKPVIKIVTATFVSFFIQTKVVKRIGLPIKEFFIWCDDIEYSRRASKIAPGYLITSSVAVHKCARNSGSNIALDTPDRIERYNYAYRNEVYYFSHQGIKGMVYWFLRLGQHMLKVLLYADGYKLKRWGVIIKATVKGFLFHPEVEYVRKKRNGADA